MNVRLLDLVAQYAAIKDDVMPALLLPLKALNLAPEVLLLPVYPELREAPLDHVVDAIRGFYR